MPQVAIHEVDEHGHTNLPILGEIAKRLEEVRRRAFELFEKRQSGADHAFDDWVKAEHELFGWPLAEMSEYADAYELQIRLPGLEASHLHVTAAPAEIMVQAGAEAEKPAGGPNVLWSEFDPPQLNRRFELPGPIDTGKVCANLEKGILTIKIPKGEPAKLRGIVVAAA